MAEEEKRQPRRARGRVEYDLKGMPDPDFDQLCFRLIRLEHPDVIKPHEVHDGGADALKPKGKGYERGWQSKHYPGAISWDECKKSFAAACDNFDIEHYTFCFPRDLTNREQKTFEKHFRQPDNKVKVDYWNGSDIQARLSESPEGERVARTFFSDPQGDMQAVVRAIEAGGELETGDDALDRLLPIGKFLAGRDAYFSYPASAHEEGEPGTEPPDESVMSLARTEEGITRRLDVVPRDTEAMEQYGPKGRLSFAKDEKGKEAYEQVSEALQEGHAVSVEEGVEFIFDQLPPLLNEAVGKPMRGRFELGPSQREAARPLPPAPWRTRMVAKTDRGEEQVDLDLLPMDEPPEGSDGALVGTYGGMTLTLVFRRRDKGGQMGLNYRHVLDDSPARDQLHALRFLRVLGGAGKLLINDRGASKRPDLELDTEHDPKESEYAEQLEAFLEAVVVIEDWTGTRLTIPDRVPAEDATGVARVAATVRNKGHAIHFKGAELNVPPEGLERLREGGPLFIEQSLGAVVLGQTVDLGYVRVGVKDYTATEIGPSNEVTGATLVRIEPKTEAAGELFESLIKKEKAKPPPPPPRKGHRKRGKKKGGRRRRR